MNASSTILVTGSTGKVGRRVIPLLVRRGVTVRAASRSPAGARPGIEPVRFDWTDESTYEAVRKGAGELCGIRRRCGGSVAPIASRRTL
jgi:uncharacterized protein YbjT (DUF2867 family)